MKRILSVLSLTLLAGVSGASTIGYLCGHFTGSPMFASGGDNQVAVDSAVTFTNDDGLVLAVPESEAGAMMLVGPGLIDTIARPRKGIAA